MTMTNAECTEYHDYWINEFDGMALSDIHSFMNYHAQCVEGYVSDDDFTKSEHMIIHGASVEAWRRQWNREQKIVEFPRIGESENE